MTQLSNAPIGEMKCNTSLGRKKGNEENGSKMKKWNFVFYSFRKLLQRKQVTF